MQKKVVKSGAYILLLIGFIVAIALLVAGIVVLANYPNTFPNRKIGIVAGLFLVGVLTAYLSVAAFQSMTGTAELEEEMEDLKEEVEQLEKK